jgi:hypothetical protein
MWKRERAEDETTLLLALVIQSQSTSFCLVGPLHGPLTVLLFYSYFAAENTDMKVCVLHSS